MPTHIAVYYLLFTYIHYTPPKNCLVEKKSVEFLRFSGFEEQNGWHE